ncbi:MAG: hypothetical protein ACRDY7_09225 [Acidimicrobiia bacterium]
MESPLQATTGPARPGGDGRSRAQVVRRLRQQVVTGTYQPPVDGLVDRLVGIILADRPSGWVY